MFTDQEDGLEERVAIIEYGGGVRRSLAGIWRGGAGAIGLQSERNVAIQCSGVLICNSEREQPHWVVEVAHNPTPILAGGTRVAASQARYSCVMQHFVEFTLGHQD